MRHSAHLHDGAAVDLQSLLDELCKLIGELLGMFKAFRYHTETCMCDKIMIETV